MDLLHLLPFKDSSQNSTANYSDDSLQVPEMKVNRKKNKRKGEKKDEESKEGRN